MTAIGRTGGCTTNATRIIRPAKTIPMKASLRARVAGLCKGFIGGHRMKRRRARFRSFPDPRCQFCGGSGFAPADGISQQGKPMTGVVRCECWTTIDLRKPKKEKKVKTVYDGRAAAYVD